MRIILSRNEDIVQLTFEIFARHHAHWYHLSISRLYQFDDSKV